jgi:2-oxoglutarate ferredoxin oxidoreductase subunit beta
MGSLDRPFNPISLTVGAEATFVARAIDSDRAGLTAVLRAAAEHPGSSFVEIYQNCDIFNDGAFSSLKDRETRDAVTVYLEHGKPMIFGADREKGLRWNGGKLEICAATDPGVLVHDAASADPSLAFALSRLTIEDCGVTPIGVFRNVDRATYDEAMAAQLDTALASQGPGDLGSLLYSGDTWTVI